MLPPFICDSTNGLADVVFLLQKEKCIGSIPMGFQTALYSKQHATRFSWLNPLEEGCSARCTKVRVNSTLILCFDAFQFCILANKCHCNVKTMARKVSQKTAAPSRSMFDKVCFGECHPVCRVAAGIMRGHSPATVAVKVLEYGVENAGGSTNAPFAEIGMAVSLDNVNVVMHFEFPAQLEISHVNASGGQKERIGSCPLSKLILFVHVLFLDFCSIVLSSALLEGLSFPVPFPSSS